MFAINFLTASAYCSINSCVTFGIRHPFVSKFSYHYKYKLIIYNYQFNLSNPHKNIYHKNSARNKLFLIPGADYVLHINYLNNDEKKFRIGWAC